MSSEDKVEIKEILHDYIQGVIIKQEANYEILNLKLDLIKEQTSKMGEAINRHETKIVELEKHPSSCLIQGKVRAIEDALLSQKSIKSWVISTVAATSGFLGLIILILKFIGIKI